MEWRFVVGVSAIVFSLSPVVFGGEFESTDAMERTVLEQQGIESAWARDEGLSPEGLKMFRGADSSEGGSAGSSAIQVPGLGPDSTAGVAAAATCYSWWINGKHKWRWEGIPGLYVSAWIEGSSSTYYGTSKDPNACGRPPLIVDVITVNGHTTPGCTPGGKGGYQGCLKISKTLYNTSTVKAFHGRSGGPVDAPRGAYVEHTATKNGVTWKTITRS